MNSRRPIIIGMLFVGIITLIKFTNLSPWDIEIRAVEMTVIVKLFLDLWELLNKPKID